MNNPHSPLTPAQLADHAAHLLRAHDRMLVDTVRNRAFHKALQNLVTADSAVLDIGAGTGIWAISAALLGARKVVAIEADEFLIGLIRRLAHEAGVGDRVEAVWGLSTQVDLGREFDIVVSETVGYDGFEEQIVPIMVDARNRFLRPGGKIVPETVGLFAAGAHFKPLDEAVPRGLPFTFPGFADLNLNAPRRPRRPRDWQLMTPARKLIEVNLRHPPGPAVLESLRASWTVENASMINCFAVWVETRLTKGVRLSTRRTSSWTPVLYPIKSSPGKEAAIEFDLCLAGRTQWSATITVAGLDVSQTRSPFLAGQHFLAGLPNGGPP
ncbi:MAG: 50S ribosomal protein L11 methyltransferase [Vicinamibacteria bacterium]